MFEGKSKSNLGKSLMTWTYTPTFSSRIWIILLTVLAVMLVLLIYFGDRFIPWLEDIPDMGVYVIILLLGPLFKYVKTTGKKQQWSLYEHGFMVRYSQSGKDEKVGYWSDYKSAEYDATRVTLIPAQVWTRKQRIPAARNAMEIYGTCRERISLAQSARIHSGRQAPTAPNTAEQRRAAMYENREKKQSFHWKDIFQEEGKG